MLEDSDPDGRRILLQIVILIFLTLINGFFAAAEMAMVSVNNNKLKKLVEEGNKKAILVQQFQEEPTKFLSTIQIAITLAGFFSSGSAASSLSGPLSQSLQKFKLPYADQVSFVLIILVLAFFTLVLGELVPKRFAQQWPEKVSMMCVKPVDWVSKIASPVIKLLTFTTNLVTKPFGISDTNTEEILSRDELRSLVREGQEQGVLDHKEKEMINSVMEFNYKAAREVMTPRINVFAIDICQPKEEYQAKLLNTKFSRIPVYEENKDNILGVIFIKDFLREIAKAGYDNVELKSILRTPYIVHENKLIKDLLRELQQSRKQLAILLDEYGGFSGIVTMEDLVEEIVGEIDDEYDSSSIKIKKLDDSTYIIDGLMSLGEINNKLDLNINTENSGTLSGFLIEQLGFIPKDKEEEVIEVDNLVFKIESVRNKRIDKIKLYIGKKV